MMEFYVQSYENTTLHYQAGSTKKPFIGPLGIISDCDHMTKWPMRAQYGCYNCQGASYQAMRDIVEHTRDTGDPIDEDWIHNTAFMLLFEHDPPQGGAHKPASPSTQHWCQLPDRSCPPNRFALQHEPLCPLCALCPSDDSAARDWKQHIGKAAPITHCRFCDMRATILVPARINWRDYDSTYGIWPLTGRNEMATHRTNMRRWSNIFYNTRARYAHNLIPNNGLLTYPNIEHRNNPLLGEAVDSSLNKMSPVTLPCLDDPSYSYGEHARWLQLAMGRMLDMSDSYYETLADTITGDEVQKQDFIHADNSAVELFTRARNTIEIGIRCQDDSD